MAYQYRGTIHDLNDVEPEPVQVRPVAGPKTKRRPRGFNPSLCGIYAGYKQHERTGTEKCQPCKDANAAYSRDYEARLKTGQIRVIGRGFNPSACGTRAGYDRHHRHNVPACGPCAEASRVYTAERRANLKAAA